MRLLFEVIIFCLVYALLIKVAKGNNPLNCLYFYPESVRKKAYEIGLADEQCVHKREKCFYTYFLTALVILLFVFVVIVNKTQDFGAAFVELYLILVIGNWFDGIVIDRGEPSVLGDSRNSGYSTFKALENSLGEKNPWYDRIYSDRGGLCAYLFQALNLYLEWLSIQKNLLRWKMQW